MNLGLTKHSTQDWFIHSYSNFFFLSYRHDAGLADFEGDDEREQTGGGRIPKDIPRSSGIQFVQRKLQSGRRYEGRTPDFTVQVHFFSRLVILLITSYFF